MTVTRLLRHSASWSRDRVACKASGDLALICLVALAGLVANLLLRRWAPELAVLLDPV